MGIGDKEKLVKALDRDIRTIKKFLDDIWRNNNGRLG